MGEERTNCPHCGAPLEADAVFCAGCGMKVREDAPAAAADEKAGDEAPAPPPAAVPDAEPAAGTAAGGDRANGLPTAVKVGVPLAVAGVVAAAVAGYVVFGPKPDYKLVSSNLTRKKSNWAPVFVQSDLWQCYFTHRRETPEDRRPYLHFDLREERKVEGLYEHVDVDLRALDPRDGTVLSSNMKPIRAEFIDTFMAEIVDGLAVKVMFDRARAHPALIDAMAARLQQTSDPHAVKLYLGLLGDLGGKATGAVPAVRKWLDTGKNAEVRRCAVRAVTRILPGQANAAQLVPVLADVLAGDGDVEVVTHTCATLAELKAAAAPALAAGVRDGRAATQKSALEVLIKLGPAGAAAADAMIARLNSESETALRSLAATALGATATENDRCKAALRAVALDKQLDEQLRHAARNAYTILDLPGSGWQMSCYTNVEIDSGGFGLGGRKRVAGSEHEYKLLFRDGGVLKWQESGQKDIREARWWYDGRIHIRVDGKEYYANISSPKSLKGDGPVDSWHHTHWSAGRVRN